MWGAEGMKGVGVSTTVHAFQTAQEREAFIQAVDKVYARRHAEAAVAVRYETGAAHYAPPPHTADAAR
jgi:hypothetical protein